MCTATMAASAKPTRTVSAPSNSSRVSAKRPLGNGDSSAARADDENSLVPMRIITADTTSIPYVAHRPPISTTSAIRSRFLNRLGIHKETSSSSSAAPARKVSLDRNSLQDTKDITDKESCSDDALKTSSVPSTAQMVYSCPNSLQSTSDEESCSDDASHSSSGPPGCSLSCSSSFSSNSTTTQTRSVSFDESVKVRPIPRFDAYPLETKHQIWADPQEIYENATRNSIEFAADNFDWQHAAEEEDFVPTETGDLIHPIHYVRQCNMQRNFLLVMAARQACK